MATLTTLIGFHARDRPFESFYSYVARLIRVNHLTDREIRKLIPADWLRLAFEPEHDAIALMQRCSALTPDEQPLEPHQASIHAWLPMPSMESHPFERLRYCPECLGQGWHSYAFQARFLLRCPYHRVPLKDVCWSCGAPIAWRRHPHTYAGDALRCTRGCDIGGNVIGGILPPPDELTASWIMQWQWVQQFRRRVTATNGPIYVMYPPCQRIWMEVDLPTSGAFAALLDATRSLAPRLSPPTPDHDTSHGAWTLAIERWSAPPGHWPSGEAMDAVLHPFRRGAYETVLPLPTSAWLDDQFERLKGREFSTHWSFEARREQSIDVLVLPSHLITNTELLALYRIAMTSLEIDSGVGLYARTLIDTLDIAYHRRCAWDGLETTDILNMSERLDGLIQIDGQTFRVTGSAACSGAGEQAWAAYAEQSYPDAWVIYPASAQALRR